MDTLRKPFFVAGLVLVALVILVEVGSDLAIRLRSRMESGTGKAGEAAKLMQQAQSVKGLAEHLTSDNIDPDSIKAMDSQPKPPGVAIPSMAFLDALIAFSVGSMGVQFFFGERLQGKIQGITGLIFSILALIGIIVAIFAVVAKVLLMIGLFLALPFGTLAYLALWGSFRTGTASALLGLLMALKLGFGGCLVAAHQGFLKSKGLILILVSSLVANLVVSFLHAMVPSILVSITDGIAAIVVLLFAAVWAIALFVGSVMSIFKTVT